MNSWERQNSIEMITPPPIAHMTTPPSSPHSLVPIPLKAVWKQVYRNNWTKQNLKKLNNLMTEKLIVYIQNNYNKIIWQHSVHRNSVTMVTGHTHGWSFRMVTHPVPPSTSLPVTRQAEGERRRSSSPWIVAALRNFMVVSKLICCSGELLASIPYLLNALYTPSYVM